MRAVRLHGAGFENISVDTVPVPQPNDNQALVRGINVESGQLVHPALEGMAL